MQTHFHKSPKKIKIYLEGTELEVSEGISVTAAVLGAHVGHTRVTEKNESRRAPYCQMGICFECLMTIDGKANQQACMIEVREGMQIERQKGVTDFTKGENQCKCNGM